MYSQSLQMDHFEACLAGMGLPARFQDNRIDVAQSDSVITITVSRMSPPTTAAIKRSVHRSLFSR